MTITAVAGDGENNGKVTTRGEIRGEMTNNEGATWIVDGDLVLNGASNAGTMRVEKGVKVTTTENAKFNNNATVENYGTVEKMQNNYGEVNNYGDATLTVNVNRLNATINNWGVVRVEWGNTGRINMKQKEADVYFLYNINDETLQAGSIENTVHGNISNISSYQHIIYTADGVVTMEDVLAVMKTYGKYTDLYIAGDYNLNDITVDRNTASANLRTITICEGSQVVINQNKSVKLGWSTTGDDKVINDGTIIVSHSAKLTGAPITNNGLIRKHNSGTLSNTVTGHQVVIFD